MPNMYNSHTDLTRFYISRMTDTHGLCSYELEKHTSDDDTKSDSKTCSDDMKLDFKAY
jgi:hypothetical protein